MDITIEMLTTVGGCAAVTTLIMQLIKAKLPTDTVQYYAVGVGMLLCVAATYLVIGFEKLPIAQAFLNGFFAGCSSVGLYDLVKAPLSLPSQADLK